MGSFRILVQEGPSYVQLRVEIYDSNCAYPASFYEFAAVPTTWGLKDIDWLPTVVHLVDVKEIDCGTSITKEKLSFKTLTSKSFPKGASLPFLLGVIDSVSLNKNISLTVL